MKDTLTHSKSHSLKHANSRDAVASLKVVVFGIGNLNFGLRIESIYKVINQTQVYYSSGLDRVGITHIGDRGEITVVDLHRRLFQSSITNGSIKRSYLIVTQNKYGELCGIPIASVPALMELPLSSVQVLPESYRHTEILGIASHVCHLPKAESLMTIFLLDIDQLLQAT